MAILPCTVVATIERVPPPSEYNLNPLYITEAEERARIIAEEKSLVKRLRKLMRKEAQIKKRIRDTRSRFNTVTYISRLPSEVLSMIFVAVVSDHWKRYYPLVHPDMGVCKYKVTPYGWIKTVLHVCLQWRRIALSTPQLWTCIAHDRLYWRWRLDFLLEHSGNLPLTLRNDQYLEEDPERREYLVDDEEDLVDYEPPGPEFFEDALCQFLRIEMLATSCSMNICSLGEFIQDNKAENGTVDAPLMRDLVLDLSQVEDDTKTMLCDVNMPSLRTLRLSNAPLELVQRWSYSSLTSFEITFEDDVDTTTLLDLFENLSALRELSVDCITSDDSFDASRSILLRDLEHLRLEGTAHGVTQLLNQLIFPSSTIIELETAPGLSATLLASIMPTILGHTASSTGSSMDTATTFRWVRPHTITLVAGESQQSRNYVYWHMRIYFWYTSVSATTTPLHSETGTRTDSDAQALCTRDSSWHKSHTLRLHLIQPIDATSLQDQMAVLDTSELLSLTLGPAPHHPRDFCGIFQRPGFPKLNSLYIDADRDSCLPWDIFEALLSAPAEIRTSSVHPELVVECRVEDSLSSNHPIPPPSTYFPLPALKTVILSGLRIKVRDSDAVEIDWPDGDIYAQLRCCVQLGIKLRVLRLTSVYFRGMTSRTTAAGIVRDALLGLDIADEVKVTNRQY